MRTHIRFFSASGSSGRLWSGAVMPPQSRRRRNATHSFTASLLTGPLSPPFFVLSPMAPISTPTATTSTPTGPLWSTETIKGIQLQQSRLIMSIALATRISFPKPFRFSLSRSSSWTILRFSLASFWVFRWIFLSSTKWCELPESGNCSTNFNNEHSPDGGRLMERSYPEKRKKMLSGEVLEAHYKVASSSYQS